MKISIALLLVIAFACSGFARVWPTWLPAHVSEVRFRDGVPGEQLRAALARGEIEKILHALHRAREGRTKDAAVRKWQVCLDVIGERPEAGRWLLNLDTGDCTFLDPLIQPVYRLIEGDRQMLKTYFRKKENEQARHD